MQQKFIKITQQTCIKGYTVYKTSSKEV